MNISIVIPTCNRPVELKKCLDSCIQQTLTLYEIIIGDDSNNDRTKNLINVYKSMN